MFSGQGLTNDMRTDLLKVAKAMVMEKERRLKVKTDEMEGIVCTDFEYTGIGGIYGLLFRANVDTIRGTTKAEYIVRTKDLEYVDLDHGFWTQICDPRFAPRTSAEKALLN